jgi:thiamine-phosphate pyrophosphorylase
MIRYYITDRIALGGDAHLLRNIERLGDTVNFIQVRERDLPAGALARLVREILRARHPSVRVLVNDRADVALACGAHGVHLRGRAISPRTLRRILPEAFQISVACHNLDDVRRAEREGAGMALLAPIFAVSGKGPALGLDVVREAANGSIPVIALGGVTAAQIPACLAAGAAGVAGIRLFQEPWPERGPASSVPSRRGA